MLLALASGLVIFALLRRLAYSDAIAALAVILFFGLFDFLSIVRSGMETPLFVCLLLLTLYAGLTRNWVLGGTCEFFLCLTRPEGLLVLVVLAAQFVLGLRQNDAADRQKALVGALIFTVMTAAWLVWTRSYYGSVIPQLDFIQFGNRSGWVNSRGVHLPSDFLPCLHHPPKSRP